MGAKFDEIFESVVQRYETGGYLRGDVVSLKPGYKSAECYKFMNDQMKKELDELAKSGLNIIITQIGDSLSGPSGGNQFKTADRITLNIAGDQGGGRFYGKITVTPDMVQMVDTSHGLPIPDQWKKKDIVIIKPEKVVDDKNHITRVTDAGGDSKKHRPTNLSLGESTIISRDSSNLAALWEETFQLD